MNIITNVSSLIIVRTLSPTTTFCIVNVFLHLSAAMAFALSVITILPFLTLNVLAASFPPILEGVSIFNSTLFPGRSISYKEVSTSNLSHQILSVTKRLTARETTICETTKGVKSYSGHVNLPADPAAGRAHEIHTYFWFFEARNDPKNAPLSLWLQGGPGVPSITAAVGENGPCLVMEDSKTTTLNPWSWSGKVNMLYIDQPVQVGFSYNTLVNGTLDEIPTPFVYKPQDFSKAGVLETNLTFLTGTFSTPSRAAAPNTTVAVAPIMWDFMQTWMQEYFSRRSQLCLETNIHRSDSPNTNQALIHSVYGQRVTEGTTHPFTPTFSRSRMTSSLLGLW